MQNLLFTFSEGSIKYLCVTFDKLTDKHDKVDTRYEKSKSKKHNDIEVLSDFFLLKLLLCHVNEPL
jgi:hypothetical protein